MLFIDPNDSSVKDALEAHWKAVKCFVYKKIEIENLLSKDKEGNKVVCSCQICSSNSRKKTPHILPEEFTDWIQKDKNLEDLICGLPRLQITKLEELRKLVINSAPFENKSTDSIKDDKKLNINYSTLIKSIFDYENWFAKEEPSSYYSAYHLAEQLNRRSCTYCNRTFTTLATKQGNKKLMRPQFDHWYPKSLYPELALSFYNLIPSCGTCNSGAKGQGELNLNDHIHPYIDKDQTENFKFNFRYSTSLDDYQIYVEPKEGGQEENKEVRTLKEMHIEEMYNAHHYELKDLFLMKNANSEAHINSIKNALPEAGVSEQDYYRLAFGTEMNVEDFDKRPFSKFKSDLLKELKIIED